MANRIREMIDSLEAQARLLREEYDREHPAPTPAGIVLKVRPGDNVQAAIDILLPTGGTILAEPGVYSVNLRNRERPEGAPGIIVRSDTDNLPADGERISEAYRPDLAVFRAKDIYSPVFAADNRSRNLAFVGAGFGPQRFDRTQVTIGGDESELRRAEDMSVGHTFDRCLWFGDKTFGQHRGLQPHGRAIVVRHSAFVDIFEVGRDSQAIGGWNGGQNILVDNCFLEGGAENVMFGGGPSAAPALIPSDITIRRSTFSKNRAWMLLPQAPSIKCLLEIKNVRRLLVEDCILEHNWIKSWDTGVAIALKAANSGGAENWATCEDVTLRNLIIRNVGSVFAVVAKCDYVSATTHHTERMKRVHIENVLAYNIGTNPQFNGSRRVLAMANRPDGFVIDHSTFIDNGNSYLTAWRDVHDAEADRPVAAGFALRNSLFRESTYGAAVSGTQATTQRAALDEHFGAEGWDIRGNVMARGIRPGNLPGNVYVTEAEFAASFDEDGRVRSGSPIDKSGVVTSDGKPVGADISALMALAGA